MHETDHLEGQLYVDIMDREVYDDELETADEEEPENTDGKQEK
jgi:peptide deformylase